MDIASYAQAESVATMGLLFVQSSYGVHDYRIAPWLMKVALAAVQLGRYDEAEELLDEAMALATSRGSDGREGVLTVLRGLYDVFLGRLAVVEAEEQARRCIDLSQEIFGPESAHTAEDLWKLAQMGILQERMTDASDLLDKAIRLVETQWGPTHESLSGMLNDKGLIATKRGRHAEAVPLYERSLRIAEARHGPDHPMIAIPLLGLAVAHRHLGDFTVAERAYRRCLEIRERVYGPEHPHVAIVLNNLGVVLQDMGDYAGSAEVYQHALTILINTHGELHSDVGHTMASLSTALSQLGRYAESVRLLRRAVEIAEKVHGPDHTRTANALNHLASMLRQRGSPREAEALYNRCLHITEKVHGSPHPNAAVFRRKIGQCLMAQGRLEDAQGYVEHAIAEAAEVLGAESYRVARHEQYLGKILLARGRTEQACAVTERSLAKLEMHYGPSHAALLSSLEGLALANLSLGNIEAAYLHHARALSIAEAAFGTEHTILVDILRRGVAIDLAHGRLDSAARDGSRATEIALDMLEDIYQVSSEHDAISHARLPHRALGTFLGALQVSPEVQDTTLARAFSLVVRTQGQVLDRMAQRRRYIALAADTSGIGRMYQVFTTTAQRLANLVVRGPQGHLDTHGKEVLRARHAKEEAERALADASRRFRLDADTRRSAQEISPQALASVLEPGTILMQFVRFPVLPVDPHDWTARETLPAFGFPAGTLHRYAAFCLRKPHERMWDLRFVDLGEATSLDSLISTYRQSIERIATRRRPSARDEAEYRAVARQLYNRLLAPTLAGEARNPHDATTPNHGSLGASEPLVFVVPTSRLHLLDFNTLLSPTGELAIERWRLHLLSSGRDLLRFSRESLVRCGEGLLAVGNPTPAPLGASAEQVDSTAWDRSTPHLCAEALRLRGPLPGAEEEAGTLTRLFSETTGEPVTLLVGRDATEAAVKHFLSSRRVVHLATHGFYCAEKSSGSILDADVAPGRDTAVGTEENPLLSCGLILAPSPDGEDGLLTAQEIVAHDLGCLDWVVLSACNSGLGQLVPGEGLLGLRRAFEMAGARTVVMALWRIGDVATRDMMAGIYGHRLAGNSTIDAVRLAQLERLRDQRQRLNRIHPALWGGIVAEGDWR